jgi:hypothetical protein
MTARTRVCPVCAKPIDSAQAVSFQHGDLLHQACWESLSAIRKPRARAGSASEPPDAEGKKTPPAKEPPPTGEARST